MKNVLFVIAIFSAFGIANARTVSIADDPSQGRGPTYYDRNAEGWYWYHDPIQEEEKQPERKVGEKPTSQSAPTSEPFSAAWVREMLPKYKDLAWTNPTPENVEAYYLLQRFAIDRSQKFAQVAQSVVIGNPYLDEVNRRPLASYAIPSVDKQAGIETGNLMKKISEKAGLFFFFKSGCSYCETMAPILKYLESDGFDILAISVDGGQLESTQFSNTKVDAGHAQKLGVTATPALFLVSEKGEFTALGQGMMAYSDLQKRIMIVAAREGWITEEDINKTRPIMDGNDKKHDMGERLPEMLMAANNKMLGIASESEKAQFEKAAQMSASEKQAIVNPDGFIEPKKLLELLDDDNRISGEIEKNAI